MSDSHRLCNHPGSDSKLHRSDNWIRNWYQTAIGKAHVSVFDECHSLVAGSLVGEKLLKVGMTSMSVLHFTYNQILKKIDCCEDIYSKGTWFPCLFQVSHIPKVGQLLGLAYQTANKEWVLWDKNLISLGILSPAFQGFLSATDLLITCYKIPIRSICPVRSTSLCSGEKLIWFYAHSTPIMTDLARFP